MIIIAVRLYACAHICNMFNECAFDLFVFDANVFDINYLHFYWVGYLAISMILILINNIC